MSGLGSVPGSRTGSLLACDWPAGSQRRSLDRDAALEQSAVHPPPLPHSPRPSTGSTETPVTSRSPWFRQPPFCESLSGKKFKTNGKKTEKIRARVPARTFLHVPTPRSCTTRLKINGDGDDSEGAKQQRAEGNTQRRKSILIHFYYIVNHNNNNHHQGK